MEEHQATGGLWRSSLLMDTDVQGSDGRVGRVADLLFDDRDWNLRWIVIDTGNWLPGRKVLVPPTAVTGTPTGEGVEISLAKDQVKDAPPLAADEPVSRQREAGLFAYYGQLGFGPLAYPYAPGVLAPSALILPNVPASGVEPDEPDGDPTLRSAREIKGYRVHAEDGEIGQVEEISIDPATRAVHHLVVETGGWWDGGKVLIPPTDATGISWESRRVEVDRTRAQIRGSAAYDPAL